MTRKTKDDRTTLNYASKGREASSGFAGAVPFLLFAASAAIYLSKWQVLRMTPDDLRRVVRMGLILLSILVSATGIVLGSFMFHRTEDGATILGAGMNGIWILVPIEAAFGNELY